MPGQNSGDVKIRTSTLLTLSDGIKGIIYETSTLDEKEMGKYKDKPFDNFCLFYCFGVIFFAAPIILIDGATVSKITPNEGSLGGETKLTIYGSAFSSDQFSQSDDPNVGNRVYLVGSGGDEKSCTIHRDGTTLSQVQCYTPHGMKEQDYYVKLVVDGVTTPDSNLCSGNPTSKYCKYKPKDGNTPTVTSFTPNSGKPEGFVTFKGKMFTDRYGSNIDQSTNGNYEKLLRVYVGPQDCGLKNEDALWGLALDSSDTDNGFIKCKTKGKSVGFFNASYIVESPYGRSLPVAEEYMVSYKDDIYMYQVFTDITSISPSSGSQAGGLNLRVNGDYFDKRTPYAAPKVYIEDTVCKVTHVELDQYLECTVAADPNYSKTYYRGNRGAMYESWTGITKSASNIDDILSLTSSDSGYSSTTLDETYYFDNVTNYVSRMTLFFEPPHSGDYNFHLFGDNGARLFVDGVSQVTSSSSWENSPRMTLQNNTIYRLEVLHYQNGGDSKIHLKAKHFDTSFTTSWTGKAQQEKQTIGISSTVVYDVQELTFSNFAIQASTSEVQQVVVATQGPFRLGLFGVFTELLAVDVDEISVSTAFNALPVFGTGESVTVTRSQTANPTFNIAFTSTRGSFPNVEVQGTSATGTVNKPTKGVPDKNTVALMLEGRVSKSFEVSDLNAGKVKTIVEGMFEAKCPTVFESPSLKKLYLDYEQNSGDFGGTRVKDTEPFCGRYSLKNPSAIYRTKGDDASISLTSYKMICFAYKGILQDRVYITYTYKSEDTNEEIKLTRSYAHTFMKDSSTESTRWYYTCHDMLASVTSTTTGGLNFRVERVWVARGTGEDIFVDAAFIGKKETLTDEEVYLRRLAPAMPNGAMINSVTVTESAGVYAVTLKPYECGNSFALFELANAEIKSGNAATPSTSASYGLVKGGSERLSVSRTSFASPPVKGLIDITFNGNTKSNLNVSLSGSKFQSELESLNGIGSLAVSKDGNCANFDMSVTFMTLPGDLPMMTVNYGLLTGIDATGSITGNVNGGLYYDPLIGDMISTVHDQPQVRVFINDVPTSCGGDCRFAWSLAQTPTVTGVTPTSGTSALSTQITITGTGFNSVPTNNTVTIGGVACTVVTATTTSITCDVGNGPVGEHKVVVNVNAKGDADHGGSDSMFTYTASASAINPSSGSLGGGLLVTLTGYGFKSGATATINSNPCEVVTVQADQLTCIVPASSSAGSVDVIVVQGNVTLNGPSFEYDSSLTATVNTVSPSVIPVTGSTVTISGTSFGGSQRTVMIGSQLVTVTSWSSTQIVIETGLLFAGIHQLKIETGNGYAMKGSDGRPEVNVDLTVTNVYPLQGSILGGTELTITGSGFGTNNSLVNVGVGNINCDITALTDTEVKCKTGYAGKVHKVTNGGTDRAFGVYYAFDRPYISIEAGDSVQWTWTTPDFVNDVVHGIYEIETASSKTQKEGGFNSGTPVKNGQFTYKFNTVGEYYVWSGYNDVWNLKNYVGTVNVVQAVSAPAKVKVDISGKEATYNVGGASDPSDSSSCQSIIASKDGCSDSLPTGGDVSKFNFAFWTCSTPIITSIDQRNGTTKTTITITGEGFSTTDCQNEVTIGGAPCTTKSSTPTSITCQMAKTGEPEIGLLQEVSLRVGNRGTALLRITPQPDKSFALIPNIDSITPESGSLAGGALLTMSGFGLNNSPFVEVNGFQCPIVSSSYIQIVCETPSSASQQTVDVSATVSIGGSPYPVKCETDTEICRYAYLTIQTSTVDSITPNTMSGSLSFTITGTGLGTSTAEVEVTIGGELGTITSVTNTQLMGTLSNLPVGTNAVYVKVKNYGKASGDLTVTSNAAITSVTPSTGSIHGETTVTIVGNGFVTGKTTVSIGGSTCNVQSVSLSQIVCITSAHAAGAVDVAVTSNSVSFPTTSYSYAAGSTPTVTSINPVRAVSGTSITITGENLNGATVIVTLDNATCTVSSNSGTEIVCTLGDHATGTAPVSVHVSDSGASNTNVEFEYELALTSISPTTGGVGGGQTVTLVGTGFDNSVSATICSTPCVRVNYTTTQFICKTPSNTAQTCDVTLTVNGLTKSLSGAYTYDASVTPTISGVSPRRGGTGGGTNITITGTGFGTTLGDVSVSIDGAACVASTVISTQIECVTGEHLGSVDTKVDVEIGGNGIAQEATSGDADFQYIDVWSSPFTWGGGPLPEAGDFVVLPTGQTLILDTDTPVLKFLLIQGGKLIFDAKNVELKAEIIMITDGGLLQVGTEEEPFQHKAIITLYGHHRSKELPIYGTKVLAVRNGTLDLHGIEILQAWTRLASTAALGSSTLQLQAPVEWNVGDEVVIASTGHRHTQSENEKKTISAISVDKMTLTLSTPLEAQHFGTEETFDGTLVEFRAEVGLLTHNVVVRGNTDPQWADEIKACPAGFDTGEFATQTCFLGRFGDEIGSSQFGGIILIHSPVKDTQEALARLSYIEVTFAGQAFRLGRYPIHFHLNGDMSSSYVRGVSIHHTFNRAVNIHGSHNTIVENTVIYNVMGGAFFLEDGIETNNTFQYNLAVFVRESSSLLNDDITPASFWVTNPNNIIRHNAAAGGSHFGYWYRMHNNPDGPSFTTTVCPKQIPLGEFYNNTAHSFGWFGLWLFPDYFPKVGGCGSGANQPAVFSKLYAWNNEKGAECVNCGATQFVDFVLVQNQKAGYEGKKIIGVSTFTDDSPMVKDSLIVAHTTAIADGTQGSTIGGIVLGYGYGFQVKNTRFVNFDGSSAAFTWASIDGTCSWRCGGYTYHTSSLSFVNSPNRVKYRWDFEGVIVDRDGSLTDKSENDWKVVPETGTLPSDCEAASFTSIGQAVMVCPPARVFHRYSFNKPLPSSLEGKDFRFINQFGNSTAPFRKKAISHPKGWMLCLLSGETYKFEFVNAEHMTNMSWKGDFYEFESDDYMVVKLRAKEFPDRVSIDGGSTFINATVGEFNTSVARYGDWTWNSLEKEINFMIHGSARSKRDVSENGINPSFVLKTFKCFYMDCIPPPDPDTIPPKDRPVDFDFWHGSGVWNDTADGYITNDLDLAGSYGLPQQMDNVRVVRDSWIIVNTTDLPQFGKLLLEGLLELMDTAGANYALSVDFIIIRGGRFIIGTPENPFQASASITVRGNHSSAVWNDGEDGPTIGAKAIAVFGGLDFHGKDKGLTWTKLASTAEAGANQIVLNDAVGWEAGDDIVLGPTSYNAWETESFRITAIGADLKTLTLNDTLRYKHISHTETIGGRDLHLGAAVGLLTHNIKIIGEDYSTMYKESCGARVIVGLVIHKGQTYTGYARISNVEFYHTGQDGYTEEYDPRFSIAYVATGTVSDVKPSSVSKCSFHNGFNTAIGAFGIGSLNITDNVAFGTVGHAFRTSSDDTRLIHNMAALVQWTGSYQDRFETFNFFNEAGFEAIDAKGLILQDNLATGSERYGFHVPPHACDDSSDDYSNNVAQACVIGVGVLPPDELPERDCQKFQNFITWKNLDFGIYYQNSASFVGENIISVEDGNGYHLHVIGPGPLTHVASDKTVEIRDGLVVGATSSFDCVTDTVTPTDNLALRLSSSGRASNGGRIGITFTNFMGAGNSAPTKPWAGIMAYNAIAGLTKIKNITFANYNPSSCGAPYAIATTPSNDDGQHPLHTEDITFENVNENQKISFHRPNVGKINSADCVDMDCDGFKKCLLKDLDGTFLGSIGDIIPQSEYEWDGDSRRGLGDYRIPKEMVTQMDGSRIPYDTIAPNKGIIRSPNCTWMEAWTAYKCYEYNYEMLIIESMDSDTETRRLSPVAILGEGYLDLINGPQDHGWCSGYTCRKRVSTFMALVATDKNYLMHFTSTTPENMRYQLLNVAADEGIKLTVWYSRPSRLDVYADGVFILATNARIDNGYYILSAPEGDKYTPALSNATGTNYFDRDRGELSIIIKGPSVINVKTIQAIIVSFSMPALTVEQFYGPNLIENIAAFFDIPPAKVRVVNIVSAQSNGRRRRSDTGIEVTVEIGDEPTTNLNDTVSNSLTRETIINLSSGIVNECQGSNLSSSLNVSGSCNSVIVPSESAVDSSVTYTTQTPHQLVFHAEPIANYEGKLFTIQPCVQAVDIANVVITQLGTLEYPWQLSVAIRSATGHPNAVLSETKTVNATNGWFNFTDLSISHMGSGYILDFSVIYPTTASNFTLASSAFDVTPKSMKINVKSISAGEKAKDVAFSTTLNLQDNVTGGVISDISWRSHTWAVTAKLLGTSKYANLTGTLSTTFDILTGEAQFTDLTLTGVGMYYIQFNAVSTPPDYNLTVNLKIFTRRASQVGMTIEQRNEISMKFNIDYRTVLGDTDKENEFEQMMMEEYSNLWPNVLIESSSLSEGSIVVTFVIAGNVSDVNATAYSLCDSVNNGTSYSYNGYTLTLSPYMTVDNQSYYGVTCGATTVEESDDTLSTGAIIGIAIGGAILLLLIVIIGILLWKYKVKSKTQTHDTDGHYVSNTMGSQPFYKEGSFIPMKGAKMMPPSSTNLTLGPDGRPTSGMSSISVHVSSPIPPKSDSWNGHRFTRPESVTMPQSYLDSEPMYIEPNDKAGMKQYLRSPSPSTTFNKMSGRVTPVDDMGSPLPPRGRDLYNTDYVTSPIPKSTTPHLPAPSPKLKPWRG